MLICAMCQNSQNNTSGAKKEIKKHNKSLVPFHTVYYKTKFHQDMFPT